MAPSEAGAKLRSLAPVAFDDGAGGSVSGLCRSMPDCASRKQVDDASRIGGCDGSLLATAHCR